MGYNTGLRTALDTYTYWSTPKSQYVTLLVLGQGVDVAFGVNVGSSDAVAAMFPPIDEYLPPGSLLRPEEFDAVRIKNHVAGSAAQYSLATRLSDDLPEGVPLGASFGPNYQTINADGTVGALFTGGIQIPEAVSGIGQWTAQPVGNAVSWTRAADGAQVAYIGEVDQLNTRRLVLWTTPDVGAAIEARIGPALNQPFRTIMDQSGGSSFWQKASATGLPSASDQFALTGPFNSVFTAVAAGASVSQVVTHNLAWAAQFPLFCGASAGIASFSLGFSNPAAPMNTITIAVRNNNTVAVTGTVFFWLAGHP